MHVEENKAVGGLYIHIMYKMRDKRDTKMHFLNHLMLLYLLFVYFWLLKFNVVQS